MQALSIANVAAPFIADCKEIVADLSSGAKFRTPEVDGAFDKLNEIVARVNPTQDHLDAHCVELDTLMSKEAISFYNNDNNVYNDILLASPLEYSKRQLEMSVECRDDLLSRISSYVNWNLPGAQFFPASGDLTEHLVGCDPLYLLDIKDEHLKDIRLMFNQQYQDRLRYYTIGSDHETPLLDKLPQGQLGFVLAWGFFNYRPYGMIKAYLKELYDVLRPGGVVLLSYNDCENPKNFDLYTSGYASFVLKTTLVTDLELLGYNILSIVDKDSNISWIEIQKPGELVSNRAGQALASIIKIKGQT